MKKYNIIFKTFPWKTTRFQEIKLFSEMCDDAFMHREGLKG